MKIHRLFIVIFTAITAFNVIAKGVHSSEDSTVSDRVIAEQRQHLSENIKAKGFGPQSPRDIDSVDGSNFVVFNSAPPYEQMNLCNIHFHKNAEHKGGEFSKYAGNGDGQGDRSGYQYSGHLTQMELATVGQKICPSKHGSLYPGDTIEVHYVHSSAQVKPGPTLESCLNDAIKNPQLRVEAQVYVLVNDQHAGNFSKLTQYGEKNGFYEALGIPSDSGIPVQYSGSTTGPNYNEKGSPFQVTWSVRPKITKVNIESVEKWCQGNVFHEDHAHGVRNLVINKDLLSPINP